MQDKCYLSIVSKSEATQTEVDTTMWEKKMIKIVELTDSIQLQNVDVDVFDNEVSAEFSAEFVADPRHHMLLAIDDTLTDSLVVGMCSAVHYIHPDKETELWINEVGVSSRYQRQGIGSKLMAAMFDLGRKRGIRVAWVLAEGDDMDAQRFYEAIPAGEPAEPCKLYAFPINNSHQKDVDNE